MAIEDCGAAQRVSADCAKAHPKGTSSRSTACCAQSEGRTAPKGLRLLVYNRYTSRIFDSPKHRSRDTRERTTLVLCTARLGRECVRAAALPSFARWSAVGIRPAADLNPSGSQTALNRFCVRGSVASPSQTTETARTFGNCYGQFETDHLTATMNHPIFAHRS